MTDKFKKEEKLHHHKQENPSLVGATFIKYLFISIITFVVLFFLASNVLPLFDQREGGDGQGNGNEEDSILQIEIGNTEDEEDEGEDN